MPGGVGLAARVDLGAGSGFEEPKAGPGEPRVGPGKPGVAVSSALAGPFLFAVASLGVKSSFGSLGTAKSLWEFFRQVVILEQSGAEQRKSSEPFQTGWLYH